MDILQGYPSIKTIGRSVQPQQLIEAWKRQTGRDLIERISLPQDTQTEWMRDKSLLLPIYAVPIGAVWWAMKQDKGDRIPYDNDGSDGDIFQCVCFSRRFAAAFERGDALLGWHMAAVGTVSVPGHRRAIFFGWDDQRGSNTLKWFFVEQTTRDQILEVRAVHNPSRLYY